MDVVVIATSCFDSLASTGVKQLWVEFGAGINKHWIPIHSLAAAGLWWNVVDCSSGMCSQVVTLFLPLVEKAS